MKLKENQYRQIEKLLPRQRGNVKVENRNLLNALIYRCENGCPWRGLPQPFGPWHTIYVRIDRWAKNGVLERVYTALAAEGLRDIQVYALDSASVKVHPDAHGAGKKRQAGDRQVTGRMEHEDSCGNGRRYPGGGLPSVRRECSGRAGGAVTAGNSWQTGEYSQFAYGQGL